MPSTCSAAITTKKRRFDVIILDPPAFAKTRGAVEGALRGYKEINLRAMKMLPEGGFLVTCSCSQHVSRQAFEDMLLSAARDAHRLVRVVEARTRARPPYAPARPRRST